MGFGWMSDECRIPRNAPGTQCLTFLKHAGCADHARMQQLSWLPQALPDNWSISSQELSEGRQRNVRSVSEVCQISIGWVTKLSCLSQALPVEKHVGDTAYSGAILLSGFMTRI